MMGGSPFASHHWGLGFESCLQESMQNFHVLPVLRGFFGILVSSFNPKDMRCRMIDIAKLSVMCEWVCMSVYVIVHCDGLAPHPGYLMSPLGETPGFLEILCRMKATENE